MWTTGPRHRARRNTACSFFADACASVGASCGKQAVSRGMQAQCSTRHHNVTTFEHVCKRLIKSQRQVKDDSKNDQSLFLATLSALMALISLSSSHYQLKQPIHATRDRQPPDLQPFATAASALDNQPAKTHCCLSQWIKQPVAVGLESSTLIQAAHCCTRNRPPLTPGNRLFAGGFGV